MMKKKNILIGIVFLLLGSVFILSGCGNEKKEDSKYLLEKYNVDDKLVSKVEKDYEEKHIKRWIEKLQFLGKVEDKEKFKEKFKYELEGIYLRINEQKEKMDICYIYKGEGEFINKKKDITERKNVFVVYVYPNINKKKDWSYVSEQMTGAVEEGEKLSEKIESKLNIDKDKEELVKIK